MSGPSVDLERTLAELAAASGPPSATGGGATKGGGRRTLPSVEPRDARRLLVALGDWVEANGEAPPAHLLEAARALIGTRPEAWAAAIRRDLELAVWEFDTSVDPRFLERADYDHAYTVEARERIDARLVALELLELDADPVQLERLEAADLRYRPFGGLADIPESPA